MLNLGCRAMAVVLLVACLSACASSDTSARLERSFVIDTHIHLYDPTRPQGVPWPPASEPTLHRRVLPEHFKAVAAANGVTHAVVVEASEWIADNHWVLDVTADDADVFIGLVGWLPIGEDGFGEQLDRLCANPRFVGLRLRLSRRPATLLTERFVADLQRLADRGKTLDIVLHHLTLDDIDAIAHRVPELNIVVDHLLGIHVTGEPVDPATAERVRQLARRPNVICKVSGLFQQSRQSPAPTDPAYYTPVLDLLWDAFGDDRVIFGSNWPVSDRGGTYDQFMAVVNAYVHGRSAEAREKLFWRNAARVYRLDPRTR